MTDGPVKDLYLLHRAGQDKYTYFLLAAAASGLGFAIQKSENLPLDVTMVLLAAAALAWLGSFYCGVRNVSKVLTALGGNYGLLQLKSGRHENQPPDADSTTGAIQGIMRVIDISANQARHYANWQFGLLVAGAVLFLGWHVARLVVGHTAAVCS